MGKYQYRQTASFRPRPWLLAKKLAKRKKTSLAALLEALIYDNAALWGESVSESEVEAFKSSIRERSVNPNG